MKTAIKLNWLKLTNFKGIQNLTINFNDQTDIFGANTAGKTSVSDAWHWLLTGKDSLDREKFNIKNTANTLLNRANHEVEAGILINNEPTTLKRVLRENWVKPKGQIAPELKGHVQEFSINNVPMLAGEYQKRINDILDENLVKLLTNPYYFNRLKWTDQRAVLFNMAGNISDRDIAGDRPEFVKLLNTLNNKPIIDYKKQVTAEKNLAKTALEKIPTRIDEANRSLPEDKNYQQIESAIKEKQSVIADIDILINDETQRHNLKNQQNIAVRQNIQKAQSDLFNAENAIRQTESRKEGDKNIKVRQVNNQIMTVKSDLQSKNALLASTNTRIERLKADKAELLQKFHAKNSEVLEFDQHEFNCPTCLRAFEPGDIQKKQTELQQNFTNDKNKALNDINVKGKGMAQEIKAAEELIATLNTQIESLNAELTKHNSEAATLETPVDALNINGIIENDLNVIALKQTIADLEKTLTEVTPVDVSELTAQKNAVSAEIQSLQIELSGKDQREKTLKRIEELKTEELELSQKIADYEGIEFTIAAFDKAKVEETEKRINGMFKLVTFKMYDYTLDGNPVETCAAMVGDVPYSDLNTAAKVQAGLDIINALSNFYQVEAPIFIDNRESVTDLPESKMQLISLHVSPEDKILRVA